MTTLLAITNKKLLLVFLVIAGLYFAQEFLIPLCIGGILATMFLPFCNWMQRKKVPKAITVLVSLLVLLSVVAALGSLIGFQVSAIIDDFELLKTQVMNGVLNIQKYIFQTLNISVKEQVKILKNEQPNYGNLFQIILGSMTSLLSSVLLVLVYFVFLLYYRNHIKNFLIKLVPKTKAAEMANVIQKVARVSQQYLIGLSKMIFILWVMYGIGFSIIGVKNAIFFAILCGVLEIIPFVGNITGTFITLLIAAMNGADAQVLISIVIVYGIVQFIQGWILEPLIVGSQVKINSLFTILALIIFELIWGIPGVILAIPLIAMFKIVCDYVPELHPYGFLIGEIETPAKEKLTIDKIKKIIKLK